ncbi:MAG: SDR family NAD(P)-dependent oxidoreductase [Gammaproteobacteria bacterium]|nr:SDR family NAD(P)-dependent oxidoreductase [Gammaproteobacteria bacterium]
MTIRKLLRKAFISTPVAKPVDLSGKYMIVTGASLGSLGYATAKQLSRWGATVVVTTRRDTEDVVAALKNELEKDSVKVKIDGHKLDLSDTASVNQFTQWYEGLYGDRLDILIYNAVIHLDLMSKWKEPNLTPDGFEIHWRTNYLGTVQLTHNLLPLLKKTGQRYGEARVVNVVSQLHNRGSNEILFNAQRAYESWQAYGLSKLALIHFTYELHRRFSQTDNLKSYCLHPGGKSGTYTNVANKGFEGHAIVGLLRKLVAPIEKLFMDTAEEGAQTQLHCAVSADAKSGHYYVKCQAAEASADSRDESAAGRLWKNTGEWLTKMPV